MTRLNIALLSGGDSSEREISIKSGNQVALALDETRYRVRRYDPADALAKLVADAPDIDAALILLHGPLGEDGTIQGLLELLGIPYQGAGVLGSALSMNKLAAKKIYQTVGLPTPPFVALRKTDAVSPRHLVQRLGLPLMVKPVSGGSSIGMSAVRIEAEIETALAAAFRQDAGVLVEAFIRGRELTCAVMGNDALESLPVVEIIPENGASFFDYQAKYAPGAAREICPADIDPSDTQKAQSFACMAHTALHCRGYSRTDMILSRGGLYVIETNTIPGMTETSLLPQAAKAAGIAFPELLHRLIVLSLSDFLTSRSHRHPERLKRIRDFFNTDPGAPPARHGGRREGPGRNNP